MFFFGCKEYLGSKFSGRNKYSGRRYDLGQIIFLVKKKMFSGPKYFHVKDIFGTKIFRLKIILGWF